MVGQQQSFIKSWMTMKKNRIKQATEPVRDESKLFNIEQQKRKQEQPSKRQQKQQKPQRPQQPQIPQQQPQQPPTQLPPKQK